MTDTEKFIKIMKAIEVECEGNEDLENEIFDNFLLYGIGCVEEKTFNRFNAKILRQGFSTRLNKAALLFLEDSAEMAMLYEALMDSTLFDTPLAEAIAFQEKIEEMSIAPLKSWYDEYIDFSDLDLDKDSFDMEDVSEDVLFARIPSAQPIETDSKFGKALELLCSKYEKPHYNQDIRSAFCQFAVGIIEKADWNTMLRSHRKFFHKPTLDRVIKHMTEELFEIYNLHILYKYPIEVCVDYVGKSTIDDLDYLLEVLGLVPEKKLKYSLDVDPIPEEELVAYLEEAAEAGLTEATVEETAPVEAVETAPVEAVETEVGIAPTTEEVVGEDPQNFNQ